MITVIEIFWRPSTIVLIAEAPFQIDLWSLRVHRTSGVKRATVSSAKDVDLVARKEECDNSQFHDEVQTTVVG